MGWLSRVAEWFTGGGQSYQSLFEAMGGDLAWAMVLSALAGAVLVGYALVWREWCRHERGLYGSVRRQALERVRRSLVLSAAGGYALLPVVMLWPGWRLYALVLAVTTVLVWRLAWTRRGIGLICRTLDRSRANRGELASARAEAQRKSFFLNSLSHDLRNPLHGLTLQAQLAQIKLEQGDTEGARHALELIRQCVDETNGLLEGFLELGRLDWSVDEPVPATFDLAAHLHAVIANHEPAAAQKGLTLERRLSEPLWAHTDRGKLERVIRNLLANAIKYTDKGTVLIEGGYAGRSVFIAVEDTGPGISPAAQQRLFDVFYRGQHIEMDPATPAGHGLGLAIADRLAKQLGTRINLDSAPGRGSRFSITLPESATVTAEPPEPSAPCAEIGRPA